MIRQYAIVSPGRAASTTIYESLIASLRARHSVHPIWDLAPGPLLAQAYAADRSDYVVAKSETHHILRHLRFPERTTLIVLSRRDMLRQVVSHLVSMRAGQYHAGKPRQAEPFRISRHEFLALAHLVLMVEEAVHAADLSPFDRVERWFFEDMVADLPGHLARLDLPEVRITHKMGVSHDATTVTNMAEVRGWARALEPEGFRIGMGVPA